MSSHPRAALVAVGDELLTGDIVDTNSAWLASRLIERGYEPTTFSVLGDDAPPLESKLRELCEDNDLIVLTGGLGPTLDDITREAVAASAGMPLELEELGNRAAGGEDEFYARGERGHEVRVDGETVTLVEEGSIDVAEQNGLGPGSNGWCGGA